MLQHLCGTRGGLGAIQERLRCSRMTFLRHGNKPFFKASHTSFTFPSFWIQDDMRWRWEYEVRSSLPARPTSCQNSHKVRLMPQCITCLIFGMWTPIPKALVQTRQSTPLPSCLNRFRTSTWLLSVQFPWYILIGNWPDGIGPIWFRRSLISLDRWAQTLEQSEILLEKIILN